MDRVRKWILSKQSNRLLSNIFCCIGSNDHRAPQQYDENHNIGIDTLSTYCLTNNLNDFSGTTIDLNERVLGVSDTEARITKKGHGIFYILDDQGMKCELEIPELYYCDTVPYRILSPQHLDLMWRTEGIGTFQEHTDSTGTKLTWTDQ
jgi:hypothetical protein